MATALVTLLLGASCSVNVPWRDERADEVNVSFILENNLVTLHPNLRIDNQPGRFILGTAARQTIVDNDFPLAGRDHHVRIQDKQLLRITPLRLDLQGVADAIVGADVWRGRTISIDYRTGLVSYQLKGIEPSQMTMYRFRNEPTINVNVNGQPMLAIVDTSSPDTLVLPFSGAPPPSAAQGDAVQSDAAQSGAAEGRGAPPNRGTVQITIAGVDFGPTDVQFANVSQVRIGNRLLSRFLVTIDYGKRVVGLWRDPRIPM